MSSAIQLPDSQENLLINSGFQVAQRGTSFTAATTPANNDDTCLLDRWFLLSDGNDIADVAQVANSAPVGASDECVLTVATANKKFGLIQFIEQKDAEKVGTVTGTQYLSASFHAVMGGATISTVRVGVLRWAGAADAVTSDVVTAWNGAGVDPTLAANWTYLNTPADIVVSQVAMTRYSVAAVSVTTAIANLALFIWVDDVDCTAADTLDITGLKLELSAKPTAYSQDTFGQELQKCQRYYWKTFAQGTAPAQNVGATTGELVFPANQAGATANRSNGIKLPMDMFADPSFTTYSPSAASAQVYDKTAAGVCTATAIADLNNGSFSITCTGNAGTALRGELTVHLVAEAEM